MMESHGIKKKNLLHATPGWSALLSTSGPLAEVWELDHAVQQHSCSQHCPLLESLLSQTLVFLHFLMFLIPDLAAVGDCHMYHYGLLVHFVLHHSVGWFTIICLSVWIWTSKGIIAWPFCNTFGDVSHFDHRAFNPNLAQMNLYTTLATS